MNEIHAHPRIILHVAGAPRVTDAGGADLTGVSRRGLALLAVLSQRRDMRAERAFLADLLWSDRGEEQARGSLRQELTALRRVLPDGVLDANRQQVWLTPSALACDATGGGDFLEGFDLPSEGFEDWLRDTRATFEPAVEDPAPVPGPDLFLRPAVLLFPFEALSAGPDDAMIAAGLTEDLRDALSCWRWFPVIGPEAIGWKSVKEVDMRTTARSVRASYAVTGTLRCAGSRVRISVSLTEVETGRSRWSQQFSGTLEDIFDFQEEVSRAIVAQLEPQISHAEAMRIARTRPASIGPWQLLAQADEVNRLGGEGYGSIEANLEQVRLMEQALQLAPDFVPAMVRISRYWFRAGLLDWVDDRAAAFEKALALSEQAVRQDPDVWEAHCYIGLTQIFGYQNYAAGRHHSLEAVRLNPSAALARHAAGCASEWLGLPEEGLEHLHLIFRLNPSYIGRAAALGDITTCEMFLGNREVSVEAARQLFAMARDYARGIQRCVATFGYFDEPELAQRSLARLRKIQPGFDRDYVLATYPYARQKDLDMFLIGLEKACAFAD
ncbi:hypothetical protein [Psychromarinibacter sp. S121]|uniref:hypothetical protein n=1 Tax=Psychromarinibacter sp. S121 TaxID=3415127 RepID=UPI003C7C5D14